MAPKKATPTPAVEARSAVDIEIEKTTEQLTQFNDQLQKCKDGMLELTNLTSRIRTLEQEVQPRETELKNVISSFNKCVENAAALKRPVGMLRTQAGANSVEEDSPASPVAAAVAANNNAAGVSPPPSQQGARPQTAPAPLLPGQINAPAAPPPPAAAASPTAADESADREAIRILAAASKLNMLALLQTVFDAPLTAAERRAEAENQDLMALVVSARKAEQPRVDIDLTCPIGVEPAVFFEVLKLRVQRVLAERAVNEYNVQINEAKAIVAKRKEEGASKLLQKKLEKQIEDTRKRLSELQREKDEQETAKRAAVAAAAQQAQDTNAGSPLKKERSSLKSK